MAATLTKTSTLLLTGLQDPENQAVWLEFDERYRPVLVGVTRRLGFSSADAEDIVQQTLAEFSHDYLAGRYDRRRGRLRSWIYGIFRHRVIDRQREAGRRPKHVGGTAIMRVPDESTFTHTWDAERAAVILQMALERLRSDGAFGARALDAFEMFGIRGRPSQLVAEECGMSVDDVYAAKYRVGEALKLLVHDIEAAYDAE